MIRVYIASKIDYAQQFRGYRAAWKKEGFFITSRWLDQVWIEKVGHVTPEQFKMCWQVDEEDVRCSDVLFLYGAPTDRLRGALIEAGMAIANRIPVITIGESPDYGTWRHHPLVTSAADFEAAKALCLVRHPDLGAL